MIDLENNRGYKQNECWVIADKKGNIVDFLSFKNNRRKNYFVLYSVYAANPESQFETKESAEIALSKCKRIGQVKKIVFDNVDVTDCYDGNGADILGYDFVNGKIWIRSKDGSKYGYDYRSIVEAKES